MIVEVEIPTESTLTVRCPTCDAEARLLFQPFVHAGYPRRRDLTHRWWDVRCEGCEAWYRARVWVRLYRLNVGVFPGVARFSTYARPTGPVTVERR